MADEISDHAGDWSAFARRVWTATLIVATLAGFILLLWLAFKVGLLFFASVLLGIFLCTIAGWISHLTRLGKGWSLAITIVGLFCLFGLAAWLLSTPISNQVDQLSQEMPKALQQAEDQLKQYPLGRKILDTFQNPGGFLNQTGGLLSKVRMVFSVSIEGVIYCWVVLFCGFFLAVRPELYRDGFLRLFPGSRRQRGRRVLDALELHLRHWIFGQIVSMSIIGLLTWLGLFLLGVQASELLGILAGVLDFVPIVGPWVAGIISCAIALLRSPMHAVYVACLFVALHLLEGHVVIPLVQREATRLPPVLTVLAMVLFYVLFGFFGLFVATPLLVTVILVTRMLYVEDVTERQSPL